MHLLAILYLYVVALRRLYHVEDQADERFFVTTTDGARLALYRYRPQGRTLPLEPVLLVHGLGANRLNFDLNEEFSLARDLAAQGMDCWLVDLRGCGASSVPETRWLWNFDDHALVDIPAALDFIRSLTGYERVHWVGHSMGGMLLYAYLLRGSPQRIASGITMGSPVCFSPRTDSMRHAVHFQNLIRLLPRVPNAFFLQLVTPLLGVVDLGGTVRRQMNPRNVDWGVMRGALYNTASHISPGVLGQFLSWMRSGDFTSADGAYSYQANLEQIETPLFVISGRGDRLVPACDSRSGFERVSSTTKRYLELCAEDGFADDYGHIDLVFGRHARVEVFPEIAAWLHTFSDKRGRADSTEPSILP